MTTATPPASLPLASAILLALLGAAYWLHRPEIWGSAASFSILTGGALGVLFQKSRFCFFCILRDFFEQQDARGLIGILIALAAGTIGYAVVFGAWLIDPTTGRLPAEAHIGPVGWPLVLAGVIFGIGMTLSGSCISGHLYRLGEGSVRAPFALIGTVIGFILGYLSWETLYLSTISEAPVVWLPTHLGYGGALALQLGVLAALALWLIRFAPRAAGTSAGQWSARVLLSQVFLGRWPIWFSAIGIGIVGAFAYLRTAPLGVTAQIGWLARLLAEKTGILPAGRLEGLDGFAGCATKPEAGLLTENGLFVGALVAAAFASALLSGDFRPSRPRVGPSITALLGGILMGWGAMIALGCTLGTLLSGISAMALSGWVFTAALVFGVWISLALKRRLPA